MNDLARAIEKVVETGGPWALQANCRDCGAWLTKSPPFSNFAAREPSETERLLPLERMYCPKTGDLHAPQNISAWNRLGRGEETVEEVFRERSDYFVVRVFENPEGGYDVWLRIDGTYASPDHPEIGADAMADYLESLLRELFANEPRAFKNYMNRGQS